jgi:hypothetical protein
MNQPGLAWCTRGARKAIIASDQLQCLDLSKQTNGITGVVNVLKGFRNSQEISPPVFTEPLPLVTAQYRHGEFPSRDHRERLFLDRSLVFAESSLPLCAFAGNPKMFSCPANAPILEAILTTRVIPSLIGQMRQPAAAIVRGGKPDI